VETVPLPLLLLRPNRNLLRDQLVGVISEMMRMVDVYVQILRKVNLVLEVGSQMKKLVEQYRRLRHLPGHLLHLPTHHHHLLPHLPTHHHLLHLQHLNNSLNSSIADLIYLINNIK
jgi:hypothetical protein